MKYILAGLICLACTVSVHAQKARENVFPSTPFNEEETAKLMEPGTATVRGTAVFKRKGKNNFSARKGQIILFPVTPYLTEYLELKKKYSSGKKVPTISNTAFTYRIEGRFMNDEGGFEFTNLKPGRYYVVTWIEFEKKKNVTLQSGNQLYLSFYSGAITSEPVYSKYTYTYKDEGEVSAFIDIKSEGETINTVVSNEN